MIRWLIRKSKKSCPGAAGPSRNRGSLRDSLPSLSLTSEVSKKRDAQKCLGRMRGSEAGTVEQRKPDWALSSGLARARNGAAGTVEKSRQAFSIRR
jgi:hypothetical protein